MLAGGTQKWDALPVKLKDAKDWIFGPAIASRDVLADCLERQWMTHRIIDIELGMEANDEAYIDSLIHDFNAITILLGERGENGDLTPFIGGTRISNTTSTSRIWNSGTETAAFHYIQKMKITSGCSHSGINPRRFLRTTGLDTIQDLV
jgi:hypothetical protein